MKIGFSLYADKFLSPTRWENRKEWFYNFSSITDILSCLKKEGVRYIEIKLPADFAIEDIRTGLGTLVEHGFEYTFHAPNGLDFPEQVEAYLQQLHAIARISESQFKRSTLFVIHGLSHTGLDKVNLLRQTTEYIRRLLADLDDTKFKFVFENLRDPVLNGKKRSGTSYAEVLYIQKMIQSNRLGICWDFGHSYAQAERGVHERVPPPEFINQVWHTHVHDYEKNTTHIPLGHGSVPYQFYIQRLLEVGFDGIFNLELNPRRLMDPENFMTYIIKSIRLLKLVLKGVSSIK